MKLNNVLSLFDGMSCLQIALNRLGIEYENYYASELDKFAIKVTQHKYPKTIQLGDVCDIKSTDLPKIDLMTGGFPCQAFSIAGKRGGFDDPRGKLFFELLRLKNELNPTYFLFENNESMDKKIQAYISRELGVTPLHFNSSLVSAQNRERIYWTNINLSHYGFFNEPYSAIPPPKEKGILLKDILEQEADEKYYISEVALARILRNTYSKAKFNPDKTGTLNTKNNSGQLSIDSGTTLIGCVTDSYGGIRNLEGNVNMIGPNYLKGLDNHGQRASVREIKQINTNSKNTSFESANRIDSVSGLAPTLKSADGSGRSIHILEKGCLKFGRTEKGKLLRKENTKNGKDYTPHREKEITGVDFDKMNTVTTVTTKDNLIIESLVVHNMSPRSGDPTKGGTGHLSRTDGKVYCLQTSDINRLEYKKRIRRLTPVECERLQTVPDNFTDCLSDSQRYKVLGNGWTIDVICHILSYMK